MIRFREQFNQVKFYSLMQMMKMLLENKFQDFTTNFNASQELEEKKLE